MPSSAGDVDLQFTSTALLGIRDNNSSNGQTRSIKYQDQTGYNTYTQSPFIEPETRLEKKEDSKRKDVKKTKPMQLSLPLVNITEL